MHVWLNKCSIGEKKRRLSKIVKYSKLLTSRVNKCWNTQTQVFGFRNKFSKLQKLKFHIKQVNYYLRYCYLQTCILAREASYHRLESLQECCGQSRHGGWVWEEGAIQWLLSLSVYYCDTCLIRFCFSIYSSLHWRSLSQWTLRQLRLIPRSRKLWVSRHTSAKAFQYCDLNEHTKDIPFHLNTPIYGNKPQDYPQLDWTF